jgi:hypothetical protein
MRYDCMLGMLTRRRQGHLQNPLKWGPQCLPVVHELIDRLVYRLMIDEYASAYMHNQITQANMHIYLCIKLEAPKADIFALIIMTLFREEYIQIDEYARVVKVLVRGMNVLAGYNSIPKDYMSSRGK